MISLFWQLKTEQPVQSCFNDVCYVSYMQVWHINLVIFLPKASKTKLSLYFSLRQKKISQKVDFGETVSPISTLYYINWHPNSQFPNSRSFSRPQKPRVWRFYCTFFFFFFLFFFSNVFSNFVSFCYICSLLC